LVQANYKSWITWALLFLMKKGVQHPGPHCAAIFVDDMPMINGQDIINLMSWAELHALVIPISDS
jgi:hypothetical protein